MGLTLLVLGSSLLSGAPERAAAAPVEITEAPPLTWGFKFSWRFYVGKPAVSDGATVIPVADPSGYNVGWEFDSGSFDPEDGTTVLRYKGTTHWTKYNYLQFPQAGSPPPGYTGSLDVDLLDVTITDPVITISRDKATISALAVSRQLSTWLLHDFGRVEIVNLDLEDKTPAVADGTTSWPPLPAASNTASNAVFGGNYIPGIAVDSVGFSYSGPGGAPDLSENFDVPGTVKLELADDEIVVPTNAGHQFEVWWVDRENRIAHYRTEEIRDGNPVMVYYAFDLDTLQVIGQPYVPTEDIGSALLVDSNEARAFIKDALEPDLRNWISFDRETGEYVRGTLAEPIPTPSFNSRLSWDPVGERAFEVVQTVPPGVDPSDYDNLQWQLLTYEEQSDGSWQKVAYDLPGFGPGLNAVGYQRLGAAASDGSIVILGDVRFAYPPTPGVEAPAEVPGAFRIVTSDDGTASVEPLAGTEVPNDFSSMYKLVTPGPDGLIALSRNSSGARVQIVDVMPAEGPIQAHPAVDLGVFDGGGLGAEDWVAFDPEDGTLWLSGYKSKRIVGVRGGEVVANRFFDRLSPRGGPLVAGPGHVLYGQTSDGAPVPFGGSPAFGFGRFERLGLAPTVSADPLDEVVTLGSDDTAEDVSFSSAATAEPTPERQWQLKAPGAVRFTNIAGQTGPTLTVSADRGMDGLQYRAVYENAGGRIASAVASLTVKYAPLIRFDLLDVSAAAGEDAQFSILPAGNPEPSVTWQRRVGGFWQSIAPGDDNFTVTDSSLTVLDANTEQSGSLFRVKLANAVSTAFSRTAKLTVTPKVAVPPGGLDLDRVSLDWSGNAEMQKAPPFGGSNYFSAGVSDGKEPTYSAATGNVRVFQVAPGGSEALASYATRAAHVANGGAQLVRLYGGEGRVEEDGSATVSWGGSFSVNFYGGLVPFTLTDPELTVGEDGTGTLSADLSGCASSQAEPGVCTPLAPVPDVTVATFSGVEVDPAGEVTVAPDYAGVEAELPAGTTAQDRVVAGWGAWPQPFVDFHVKTGLSSYWYTSGSGFDSAKPPSPFLVDFDGASLPPIPPAAETVPPASAPAPGVQKPQTGSKSTQPPIASFRRAPVDGSRRASVATLSCPADGSCAVSAPRRVAVTIAGQRYWLRVLAPRSIEAGGSALVRVRLSDAALDALGKRTARVRVLIALRTAAGVTEQPASVWVAAAG